MSELSDTPNPPTPSNPSVPPKKSGCLKGCLVGCLITTILIIVALAIGGFVAYSQVSKYLNSSSAPKQTTLEIVSGTANVKPGPITDGTTITTGKSSLAIVTFTDSSQLRLDEQTTVTITSSSDHLAISQTLGRTWTRFINLTGKHTYTLTTPNAIATVRGTAFSTTTNPSGTLVATLDGTVNLGDTPIPKGMAGEVIGKLPVVTHTLTPQELSDPWFITNQKRDQVLQTQITTLNPFELFNAVRSVSPSDLETLRQFATRTQSGNYHLTETQVNQLEPIAKRIDANPTPQDIAAILAVLDPQLFADQAHWTQVATNLMPLVRRLQLQDSLRLESTE